MIIASFLFFLAAFVVVGVSSYRRSSNTSRDYLLASSHVQPWLVALSAIATNNSGYMFIGVIGFTYAVGWSSVWLMFGWIVGDFLASTFIHRRLREATERTGSETYAGLLSSWNGTDFRTLRRVAALISILFLSAYAAAQLKAGSKALHVLFGWPEYLGALIGAAIVLAYCLAGGLRASIWTDAAQSVVMITAMAVLLFVATADLGGPAAALSQLNAVGPDYMNWFPHDLPLGAPLGPVLFVVGWLFAGFSVVGQPHVMVRFMALDDARHMTRARAYYYSWFVAFYAMATAVGLLSRLLIPESGTFDAELALPTIALQLLPDALVGLILAGVFAATMSTADSLLISCAGSLTDDLLDRSALNVWLVKGATLLVTLFALGVAVTDSQSVFSLVIYAWAGLAAAFGPLLAVYALGHRPGEKLALTMMVSGVLLVFAWKQVDGLGDFYEGTLAIVAGFLIFLTGRALGLDQQPEPSQRAERAEQRPA
ncbi:MAG: sodium/proline symporter [Pseudomonadales bacterium]